jgi:dihydrofolate reductase
MQRRNEMRKLVVGAFLTLDGVMQAPGGPDEDRDGGFTHGGWAVPLFDEQMGQYMTDLTNRAGALLLGRKTYDIFAASWPQAGDDDPIAAKLNSVPKYVASRTLKNVEWNNSTLLTGDVVKEVAKLKQQDGGEIQVSGSGELVQTLLKHDLVDEYHLLIFPVLVGGGKRLFADGTVPIGLKLVETTTSSTGVTISTYERHGALEYGTMEPDQVPR